MQAHPTTYFVTESPDQWSGRFPDTPFIAARTYLTDLEIASRKPTRVINLCSSLRYQSLGYYVSLIGEARCHHPQPRIETVQNTKLPSMIRLMADELSREIPRALSARTEPSLTLRFYFSHCADSRYEKLARRIYNLVPAPLLRASFTRTQSGWRLSNLDLLALRDIPADEDAFLAEQLLKQLTRQRISVARRKSPRFYMAILYDAAYPGQKASNERAIRKFMDAADDASIACELVGREDLGQLLEYDALFIRETTAVNHFTYRFASKASWENLVVMDDPQSILKCANKVYLSELMARLKIATPRTLLLDRQNAEAALEDIALPAVLKVPDSSFSLGVKRAHTREEWMTLTQEMLRSSELIIAQEFMASDFDWRVTILNREVLFVCKYYMAHKHWQIYKQTASRNTRAGRSECIPIAEAPPRVLQTALRAANAIGDGLYGVDIKQVGNLCVVIEVNDNPSIDAGVEDAGCYGDIYTRIMNVFLKRLEQRAGLVDSPRNTSNRSSS